MTAAITLAGCMEALVRLRTRAPLVQNITNFVAMTPSANMQLAIGASPAMVHAEPEAGDFARRADALIVNIGTLSPDWVPGMRRAIAGARETGKPWVLDPVGCGGTAHRTGVAVELAGLAPTIIRGNAGEIIALAGASGAAAVQVSRMRGVDSLAASGEAIESAMALARHRGAVVAITGSIDYATDGTQLVAVEGGHALMPRSTALGCALSAITAAFAVVAPPLDAAVAALAIFGAAGAEAAARCRGPGHLPAEICDALYLMDEAMLARHASVLGIS